MTPHPSRRRLRSTVAFAAAASLTLVGLAGLAAPAHADPTGGAAALHARPREGGASLKKMQPLTKAQKSALVTRSAALRAKTAKTAKSRLRAGQADVGTGGTPIGGEKLWLGNDDTDNSYFASTFVLRTVTPHMEVWVQKDLTYPNPKDCRNDGIVDVVTTAQTDALAAEFESNILPKESTAFSVAPAQDGSDQEDVGFGGTMTDLLGGGDPSYYKGDGNKTVTLVSNIRDANYYDASTPEGSSYIAGYFSPVFNQAFDRNIMTIDSFDWLHATGADPVAGPTGCGTAVPQPRVYEGTFAHEYQHLLEYYQDPNEETWLNEGMSMYAEVLTGYTDSRIRYPDPGADEYQSCFEGWYGRASFPYCGAEQSLTRWGDQGDTSIIADYGAAAAFVTYVSDQFGEDAVSYLHRDARNGGLASVQDYLDDHAPGLKAIDVVHDWEAAMAVDGWLDGGAKGVSADQKNRFSAAHLRAGIDWAWTGSYDSPGAPTNGSDYVLGVAGRPVNANTLSSISFTGAKGYATDPLLWKVDSGALWSGEGDEQDRSAVYSVKVPAGSPKLTFDTKYDIEQGWDFGAVQVSTDGGKTYRTLANADTTGEHNAAAESRIVAQLPGFTGVASAFRSESFDLSAYAGTSVKLSFRYLTDAASNGNGGDGPTGWWVKNVHVGSTVVTTGTSLKGAKSATQVRATPVAGWSVQAVGWSLNGKVLRYHDLTLDAKNHVAHSRAWLKKRFKGVDRVAFIVSVDDVGETATKYVNYTLNVNGVRQPGGAGDTNAAVGTGTEASRVLPISTRRTFS